MILLEKYYFTAKSLLSTNLALGEMWLDHSWGFKVGGVATFGGNRVCVQATVVKLLGEQCQHSNNLQTQITVQQKVQLKRQQLVLEKRSSYMCFISCF